MLVKAQEENRILRRKTKETRKMFGVLTNSSLEFLRDSLGIFWSLTNRWSHQSLLVTFVTNSLILSSSEAVKSLASCDILGFLHIATNILSQFPKKSKR